MVRETRRIKVILAAWQGGLIALFVVFWALDEFIDIDWPAWLAVPAIVIYLIAVVASIFFALEHVKARSHDE
ncbi:MAG: hypothetical protein AAGK09_11445 [Planctomycetota bacterium]